MQQGKRWREASMGCSGRRLMAPSSAADICTPRHTGQVHTHAHTHTHTQRQQRDKGSEARQRGRERERELSSQLQR